MEKELIRAEEGANTRWRRSDCTMENERVCYGEGANMRRRRSEYAMQKKRMREMPIFEETIANVPECSRSLAIMRSLLLHRLCACLVRTQAQVFAAFCLRLYLFTIMLSLFRHCNFCSFATYPTFLRHRLFIPSPCYPCVFAPLLSCFRSFIFLHLLLRQMLWLL